MASSETGSGKTIPLIPDDHLIRKTELIISGVLRGGVLLSIAVILAGVGYFYALRLLGELPQPAYPDTLTAVASGLMALYPAMGAHQQRSYPKPRGEFDQRYYV